jgi:hypothetical protein
MDAGTVEWTKVSRRKEVGPPRQRNMNNTTVSEACAKVVEPHRDDGS